MRRFRTLGVISALALVLVACSVTIAPVDPFPGALPATAVNDPATAIASFTLAGTSTVVYEVIVPAAVISGDDVLFFELDTESLGIVVYNSAGTALASSASSDGFVSGDAAVSLIGPSAITALLTCRGSCVILPASTSTFFVEVVNEGGSSVPFDLFVFGDDEQDEGEPDNDTTATAPPLSISTDQTGAIETLGDVDLYAVQENGTVMFDSPSPFDLIAEVLFNGDVQSTLQPGESAAVFTGDTVRVSENGGNAAGPSASSRYALSMTGSTSPFPGAVPVSAGTDPNAAVDSDTVAASGTNVYEVDVAGGAASSDLLYIELDTESAAIVVYNSGGTALASSTTADRFVSGGGAAARFSTAGISVEVICRGSCVILEAPGSSYFVEVINETGTPLDYELFAFGDAYQDTNEALTNDVPAGGPDLVSTDQGAIETLEDEDYFQIANTGILFFSSTSSLDLRADLIDDGGSVVDTLLPGESTPLLASDDRVRVYELGGDAAGPSGASGYTLGIE